MSSYASPPSYTDPPWFPRVVKAVLAFILFAFLIILFYEGKTSPGQKTAQAPIPARPTPGWREIGRWRGEGQKATEHFYVSSSPWRIIWIAEDSSDFQGHFAIWVYEPEEELPSKLIANTMGTASDVSYLYLRPGTYYLDIQGTLNAWGVEVQVKE